MTEQKRTVSNGQIWIYALMSSFQTIAIMTPYMYGTMFMTTYLGITMVQMATVFTVAKVADFFICLTAGAVIESANFKKGKYVPILEIFRWTVTIGAVGQMLPIGGMPFAAKFAIIAVSYILMHGSMNYLSTVGYGLVSVMAGGNYTDRIAIAQRNTQISAGMGILRSFGTVPVITLIGKLANNAELGYTIYTAIGAVIYLILTMLFVKSIEGKEQPRDPNAPRRIVTLGDMVKAVGGNDQLIVYLIWQIVVQLGTQIVSVIGIYYWTLVMAMPDGSSAYLNWYSIGMGISTTAGFIFSLFVPKIGVKLGKLKSLYIAQFAGWAAYVLYRLLGLKSVYFMTLIGVINSGILYLQSGFGANYVLDIGEYGYYKTGKDYRAVVSAFSFVPMKMTSVLGGLIGPLFLAKIGFDKFNAENNAGTLDRASEEFKKFQNSYMNVYCFVPLACSVIGFIIFKKFYKITDDKAVFYAKENAAKAAAAAKAE
ncbi:MAG: MFS transporter [Eubacteriaceae bacterium]|nr:MFS transporter [Eubacteriaceae bacterium]